MMGTGHGLAREMEPAMDQVTEDTPQADLRHFCCQNPRCLAYGGYGAGNLKVCGRIGKHKDIRLLLCRTCKKRFSERKGTVFYRSHTPPAKVVSILQHVQDGCGMRQTGRLEKVKEDTVIRYARLAGGHARQLHERLLAFSPGHGRGATG